MSFIKKANAVNKNRVICEIHREMFDLILPLQETMDIQPLVDLLEEANTVAKKWSSKLYSWEYNVNVYSEKNENYEISRKLRKDRDVYSK